MLTQSQLDQITYFQEEQQQKFKSVPDQGVEVEYFDKTFVVHKNVFWPFEDSKPLVESLVVNQGESVLDVGTGSGVIAVFAAYKGAGKVVALDINLDAVRNAQANAALHGFTNVIDVRLSDVFSALKDGELFDVIIANLPFRDLQAPDVVAMSQWDTGLRTHKKFFARVGHYLKERGRVYLAQSNYGACSEMKTMAREAGFEVRLLEERRAGIDDPRIFYAFELVRATRT